MTSPYADQRSREPHNILFIALLVVVWAVRQRVQQGTVSQSKKKEGYSVDARSGRHRQQIFIYVYLQNIGGPSADVTERRREEDSCLEKSELRQERWRTRAKDVAKDAINM